MHVLIHTCMRTVARTHLDISSFLPTHPSALELSSFTSSSFLSLLDLLHLYPRHTTLSFPSCPAQPSLLIFLPSHISLLSTLFVIHLILYLLVNAFFPQSTQGPTRVMGWVIVCFSIRSSSWNFRWNRCPSLSSYDNTYTVTTMMLACICILQLLSDIIASLLTVSTS